MSTSLVPRRDYLAGQRRMIVARAILSGIAGAVPLPFLDDWAIEAVVGRGYRNIAASHQVDLDDEAVANLVHGTTPPPTILDLAAGGVMLRIASKAARRMMFALTTVNRARSAARTFVTLTLFDHYCAKLHKGLALDGATALQLREDIGRAIDATPGALSFHPFRRGALAAAKATLRTPLALADMIAGGRLRKLLAAKSEVEVAEPEEVDALDHAIDTEIANKRSFFGRTVAAVESQLSAEVNPFLDAVIDLFDRRWRARP